MSQPVLSLGLDLDEPGVLPRALIVALLALVRDTTAAAEYFAGQSRMRDARDAIIATRHLQRATEAIAALVDEDAAGSGAEDM